MNVTAGAIKGADGVGNIVGSSNPGAAGVFFAQGGPLYVASEANVTGGKGSNGFNGYGGGAGGAGAILTQSGTIGNAGGISGGIGGSNTNFGASGGSGVNLLNGGVVNNYGAGILSGGAGANSFSAGSGGAGVLLTNGGQVNNSASIFGGAGGASSVEGAGFGGAGGAGVVLSNGGADFNSTASGLIQGGAGGFSGNGLGGTGGAGVQLQSGGSVSNTDGKIVGGQSGAVNPNSSYIPTGGAGGTGVSALSGGALTNAGAGSILGGAGQYGASNNATSAGAGGAGVYASGLSISNYAGATIGGGAGGSYAQAGSIGGTGGVGVYNSSATIVNAGTILGGKGGGSYFTPSATNITRASGGVAITGSDLVVINSGTISGGLQGDAFSIDGAPALIPAPTAYANAITFTGGTNRLTLLAGYVINGNVVATTSGNDVLELGGATDASFDASAIAPAGSTARQYQNFGLFQKTGSSTWTLTGSTTAVTPWTVTGGTLAVASDGALGDASGRLTLDGGALRNTASFSTSCPVTLGAGGGTFNTDPSTTLTLSGALSGPGGLAKTGTGTLILSGTAAYKGATNVGAGTLQGGGANAFSAASATSVALGATLDLGGFAQTINAVTLNGGQIRNGALTSAISSSGGTVNGISGSASLTTAGGVTFLSGTNAYSGATNVGTGTLAGAAANAFSASSALNVASVATVDLNGYSQTVSSLSGAGKVVNGGSTLISGIAADLVNANAATLTIGSNNASSTFSGSMSDGSGALALTKIGSGVQTLSGVSSYSGATIVNAGTLQGGAANAFSAASATSVASGATLDLGGFSQTINSVTLSGGTLQNGALTGAVAASGSATLSNVSVTVSAANASALSVSGNGATATLKGPTNFTASGAGGAGVLVGAGTSISASGTTSVSVTGKNATGLSISGGAASFSGSLTINASDATSNALTIDGSRGAASFSATAGGSITASGTAIRLINGAGLAASFSNFTIKSGGDLIFVDPTVATVNFNSTTADAGSGNLINATNASTVTLNSNASTLTGAIQTDATSTTTVNLNNGSVLNLTASSTLSNLSLNNSVVTFAPSTTFRTLTVGNYASNGGELTFNVALGANPQADQLIINGGTASGVTKVALNNVGPTAVATTGRGIPLITTINGGTTAVGAFQLNQRYVFNGLEFQLLRSAPGGSDPNYFLRTQLAPTTDNVKDSLTALAKDQLGSVITSRVLGSILLGSYEQINCSGCASGFGGIGSFDIGAHGRWLLSDNLTLLAGASFNEYETHAIKVTSAPMAAASLRYDFVDLGRARPFVEAGASVAPGSTTKYSRSYFNGVSTSTGNGSATNRSATAFVRVGYVARITPTDEAAVFGDLARSWEKSSGYTELTNASNPFPATISGGIDSVNIVKLGGQFTHLFQPNIEANINLGVAHSFAATTGSTANIDGFGQVKGSRAADATWVEYGGRIGYRWGQRFVADMFVLGTLGAKPAGSTIHGGVGIRYAF